MGASISYERTVAWAETDASGHYHNSTVMRLFEAAEAALVRDHGLTDYFGVTPRVRQEIDFEAKLYFDQPTTTVVTVERMGRTSMTYRFEVWGEPFRDQPRARAASGIVVVAHVPVGSPSARPWPEDVVAALGSRAADG
ncbi:acyl-CoA thioesterase [Georgenia sp. Z1491]|uniref:acyl-CoA thioesterase n=1 Tax=Georgenia sp. Z1491 TaxID=3416707 RepID=UPI003CE68143